MPRKLKVPRRDFSDIAPFKIDGEYCRLIGLTQGQVTIVNADDYDWLMQWAWIALFCPKNGLFYATRDQKFPDGKRYQVYMHLAILGVNPGSQVSGDHVRPAETLLNTRTNLRISTKSQQAHNKRIYRNNTSGFKGVSLDKTTGKYVSYVSAYGKRYHCGSFMKAEDAFNARCDLGKRLHGKFFNKG